MWKTTNRLSINGLERAVHLCLMEPDGLDRFVITVDKRYRSIHANAPVEQH